MRTAITPTGQERTFDDDEIIVSKTDPQGRIMYVNDVFLRVSAFAEDELIGQPHNIIRHPDMPRSVFRLLWETLGSGRELFAYIVNLAADGAHYWVLAHVTPTFDGRGQIVGFHSNRRTAAPSALAQVEPVYAELLREERRHTSAPAAAAAGARLFADKLAEQGLSYDEWVWSLDTERLTGAAR
ncbi:PAS domain-containing protein [Sporichthya brevicatena]|uniref:PAS domain-containing protein n=1 Tax=Sporichthya brevicatena TaxID=171442 RepID=A0ABN1H872_9ACTN